MPRSTGGVWEVDLAVSKLKNKKGERMRSVHAHTFMQMQTYMDIYLGVYALKYAYKSLHTEK